jgi:hypothetical protein
MSNVPRTALPGSSRSANDRMARGLGYFSLALGLCELLAPHTISGAAGLDGHDGLVRGYGVREIATGVAILQSHDATPWVWGRVAGDVADIATVTAGAKQRTSARTLATLAVLGGALALDAWCATRLAGEKGGPETARTDYGDRSGFPKGVLAAKEAGKSYQPPRDMRTPEALRPFDRQRQRQDGSAAATSATSI